MNLTILSTPTPLETNPDGVVLVGKTRVTLDTVVAVFNQGATAEEIVFRYPFGQVIEDIITIIECSYEQELEGQIQYLPL